ncbi:PfkB family carbohydrate kinase [Vibrio lamellibrachiae]|uniref:ribokinase n=1 Tax=Vibrio lamellibrachiae TaxID=2910253 RepID=UPI003D0FF852
MDKYTRINTIRISLLKDKIIYTRDLEKRFNVTGRTIRRDLLNLQKSGIAELIFGGAKLIESNNKTLFRDIGIKNIMSKLVEKYPESLNIDPRDENSEIGVYVLGSFNIDIVSEVIDFPKVGQTIHSLSTNFYAGGKGSNQATAASIVCDNVHLAVKIGNDSFGLKARDYFAGTNIRSKTILEDDELPTGNAMIIVSQETGDNIITIDLAANQNIHSVELMNEFALIERSKIFLTQLENNFEITRLAIEHASRTPATVMVNPAPYQDSIKSIMHLIDIITPNETEAHDLSGIEVIDLESAKEAALEIYKMGPKIVVITLGANGSLLFNGNNFQHFKPFKAVVNDTSGAGDSFNGSLAASLANGESLEFSLKYASAFASLAVERKGASNMPDSSLVEARLSMESVGAI